MSRRCLKFYLISTLSRSPMITSIHRMVVSTCTHAFIHPSMYSSSIHPFIYLCIYLSICLSVCLSVYPNTQSTDCGCRGGLTNQIKENRSTYPLTKRQINLLISTLAFQQSNKIKENRSTYPLTKRQINLLISTLAFQQSIYIVERSEYVK